MLYFWGVEFSESLVIIVVCIVLAIVLFGSFVIAFVIASNKKVIEKQNQLFEAVLKAQETEQQRVGRDLHDGVGPLLTLIKHHSEELGDNTLLDLTKKAIQGVRAASHNLSPPGLEERGLNYALNQLVNNWLVGQEITVDFVSQTTCLDSPTKGDVHVYHIVSELVQNAVKHAQSSVILIHAFEEEKLLKIHVQDDGVGMQTHGEDGLGLKSIKDRVHFLKGKMEIVSSPNEGTSVQLSFQKETFTHGK